MRPPNAGGVAKLSSWLNTFIPTVDNGEKKGKSCSELYTKKEFAGKARQKEKG